jgi:hypothetical protein
VLWFLIKDAPPIPDYASTYQSGTYLIGGQPKPAAQAFRFPFIAVRHDRRILLLWGKAPDPGPVRIERDTGSGWRLVGLASPAAGGIFNARLALPGRALLRARQGTDMSLGWRAPA